MVVKTVVKEQGKKQPRLQIGNLKSKGFKANQEVVLYTLEEHNNITSRLNALKEDVAIRKQQLEDATAKIKDLEANKQEAIADQVAEVNANAEALQQEHQKQLEDATAEHNAVIKQLNNQLINQRSNYESLLKDKEATIKDKEATIKDKEDIINDKDINIANLQQQVKRHNNEVNALKEANIFITGKYNALRQAIINKSSLSLLFGGKKQLLIDYQEVKPSDEDTIEAKATPSTNTDQ